MDNADIIGSIKPLIDKYKNVYGLELTGDYIKLAGLVVTSKHPSKITIADGGIDFTFEVNGKTVTRSFVLEKTDSKITAFVNDDGTRTEVEYSG